MSRRIFGICKIIVIRVVPGPKYTSVLTGTGAEFGDIAHLKRQPRYSVGLFSSLGQWIQHDAGATLGEDQFTASIALLL